MIEIKREEWSHEPGPYGKPVITMNCLACGRQIRMQNHKVQDNGYLWPSVCCPHVGCKFHGFIELLGWDPNAYK